LLPDHCHIRSVINVYVQFAYSHAFHVIEKLHTLDTSYFRAHYTSRVSLYTWVWRLDINITPCIYHKKRKFLWLRDIFQYIFLGKVHQFCRKIGNFVKNKKSWHLTFVA
jgi:hypothetical protein